MQSNTPLEAILKLVAYLETDERKHFERRHADAEDVGNHIYNSVKVVSDWLDTQPGMTTAAERERQRLKPIVDAFNQVGVVVGDFAEFWQWQQKNSARVN